MKFISDTFKTKQKLFAFPFTDDKVGLSFFNTVFNENSIDNSFGTAGIKDDSIEHNIQRIPIENYKMSAERIIKTEYLMYILKRIIGKHKIKRR